MKQQRRIAIDNDNASRARADSLTSDVILADASKNSARESIDSNAATARLNREGQKESEARAKPNQGKETKTIISASDSNPRAKITRAVAFPEPSWPGRGHTHKDKRIRECASESRAQRHLGVRQSSPHSCEVLPSRSVGSPGLFQIYFSAQKALHSIS